MRKTKLFLLMAAMLLGTLSTSAYDFMVDGIAYNKLSNNTDVSVSYLSVRWETQTPSDPYGDFEYIYYYNEKIKYSGYIEIPSVVNYGSVTYNVTSIAQHAFQNCSNLTSITIPESVTSIGNYAFKDCSRLASITLSENLTSIGYYAFENCSTITSVNIPESVTTINGNAFSGCSNLISITIPKNSQLMSIGNSAFYNCSSLTAINIPEGVTSIGSSAFYNCSSLTAINIPEGVTSIGDYAFRSCSSLTSITIPESVTRIGYASFYGCSSLTSITIPESVPSIEGLAFYDCSSLTSIACKAVTPPTIGNSNTFYNVDKSIPVYVPAGSVDAYKAADYWNEFTNIIGMEELKEIVEEVTIDDAWESFDNSAKKESGSITYTRNFRNTNWQALYVPFEIPVTEALLADFEVAYIYDARQYDRDDDGVKDETVIELFKKKSGTLEANYPYLIRAKEAGEKFITVTDATLYITEENSYDCSSMFDTYTFAGTYSRLPAAELAGCYALSGGVWQPIADGASLGAFRFYMKIESRDGNAQAARNIRMRVVGDDDATGMEMTSDDRAQTAVVYDLQGRRVANPTKGIYIVNGKKVLYQ